MSPPTDAGDDDSTVTSDALVLDYFPHGRADDDRPQYQKSSLAYALGVDSFTLYELSLTSDADVSIGDYVQVSPEPDPDVVSRYKTITYDNISGGARSELEYAITDIIETDEQRFVDFYNNAQPITLRLHQLNLLPGIGKKLRNNILDQRKRGPFESFEQLSERVSGLHRPKEILAERILEELRDDDLKYRAFVRPQEKR
ncbi:DUF655 domain-containing protein [Natronocalculus amylovorans]|uniref:DUF655 domain-containing protein n=1 Tax=Natronocalculus amylovorans TaxID=2917812 RepID=A0AAE3FVU0_9EURY|nr:DUF655 domain-containing protein [Natronocalculus amylovorans]MCL9816263.1 DUF655 domain-containing protein [Natronocalculus amylovorans]